MTRRGPFRTGARHFARPYIRNAQRKPSPLAEGDSRAAQLDLIPTDMIQTIEVNKVVTADMDGDAIGGAVNLVTKNSPYRQTLSANGRGGLQPHLAARDLQRFGSAGARVSSRTGSG